MPSPPTSAPRRDLTPARPHPRDLPRSYGGAWLVVALAIAAGCTSPPLEAARDAPSSSPPSAPSPTAPAAVIAVPARPAPAVDVAAINKPFRDLKEVQSWVARFERENREIFVQRHAIVAAIGLEPGLRVADVGAGTGLFEPLLSLAVGPAGRVYALDIAPLFVDHIRRRALMEALPNVRALQCPDTATGLPPGSVDLVFLCDTYHHFEQPERNLASIRETLVDGGRLVVVDFEKEPGKSSEFVMGHVRAGKATVIAEITAAGFELEREEKLLRENYFLVFRRS